MQPCSQCGRVNPSEATYCMTCGHTLREARFQEEPERGSYRSRPRDFQTGGSQHGRFEQVGPVLEDFAWDVVRAGVRLYFGLRRPDRAGSVYRTEHRDASVRDRLERLKDVIAEARVDYRRRGGGTNCNRSAR